MRDEKNRFSVLSAKSDQRDTFAQSGLWERLLCAQCESKLSLWERYGSLVLGGAPPLDYRCDGDFVYVSGLDYTKFRLFQLSILWKSHASTLPFFEKVVGAHGERLRVLLNLNCDTGRYRRYGTLMFGLRFDGSAMSSIIVQPSIVSTAMGIPVRIWRIHVGVYLVSSHDIAAPLDQGILQPNGTLMFLNKDAPASSRISQVLRLPGSQSKGLSDTASNKSLERTREASGATLLLPRPRSLQPLDPHGTSAPFAACVYPGGELVRRTVRVAPRCPDICGRIENPGEKSSQTRFAGRLVRYLYTPQLHASQWSAIA